MSVQDKTKAREAGVDYSLEPDDELIIDVDLNDKANDNESKSQAESFQIDEQPSSSNGSRSKGNLLSGVRNKASNAVNKAKGVFTKQSHIDVERQKPPTESPSRYVAIWAFPRTCHEQ